MQLYHPVLKITLETDLDPTAWVRLKDDVAVECKEGSKKRKFLKSFLELGVGEAVPTAPKTKRSKKA